MEFTAVEQAKQNGSGSDGLAWPEPVDVAVLSLRELRDQLGLIKAAESRLAAMKAVTLAAYSKLGGEVQARQVVLKDLQASPQQARREVQAATELTEAPETLEALAAGEIPEAHAKKIAKAVSEGPVDEAELVESAKTEDFGTFTRTVRDQQHQQSDDDGTSLLADKRKRRSLGYFTAPDDGMFVLRGRFDPVAGSRIEAALAAEIKRQRNGDSEDGSGVDQMPFDQRLADALENLVCADPETRKPDGTYQLQPPPPNPHAGPPPPKSKPNPDELTLDSDPFPDTGFGVGVPAGIQPLLLC